MCVCRLNAYHATLRRQALVMGGITPEMAIAGARLGVLERDVENRIYDMVVCVIWKQISIKIHCARLWVWSSCALFC
jgi:hypothetical protein